MSTLNVNTITPNSGTTITIGGSGDTVTLGSGASQSGFGSAAYAANASASTGAVNIDASDNLQFDSGYGSTVTAYGCRAWVNFNGTGTVAIRDSGNVSSITDTGTGDYTVNFTTAMPDSNYSFLISGDGAGDAARTGTLIGGGAQTPTGLTYAQAVQTTLLRVTTRSNTTAGIDYTSVTVAIIR
jgi:azurin